MKKQNDITELQKNILTIFIMMYYEITEKHKTIT